MRAVTVIISGGFQLAYDAVRPAFERETGIDVRTLSGASQGAGPRTIRWQLETGTTADVVILSREGLGELTALGRVADASAVDLASVPLAAAVRRGGAKLDIGTVAALEAALLSARLVVMPGSTSGLFVRNEIFPRLGIADRVSFRMMTRGTDSTAALAAGDADLAIGPVSELVDQPGIEIVGPLPDALQLVQVFVAALVEASDRREEARRLIAFLASESAEPAIRSAGMTPLCLRPPA